MTAGGFRVIIVGGGPVGLTAAHALERAGIDFVLLEQRSDVIIDAGANLVLLPIGMRALADLGVQDELDAVSTPLARIDRLDHNSRDIGDVLWFEQMKKT
jgi:2-polyprenyl-6-methoxyphenol hydroxylase-like FAD-dependent oxidoreductase